MPRVLFACTGWPCGILDVASWIDRLRLADVRVFQMQPSVSDESLTSYLKKIRPHVVGFRIEGGQFEAVCRWVEVVRRHSDAVVVLGGPTATSHPLEVLEECRADYVFAGDAEEPFARFLELARQPNSIDRASEIPGLAFCYGGRAFFNAPIADGYGRTAACDRPMVPRDVLRANRLNWSLLENFQTPTDSLFFTGGRGCPGSCSFCAKLHGSNVRVKSAEQLLDEIATADRLVADGRLRLTQWPLFEHTDVPELQNRQVAWAAIYDEDFFLDRRRAVAFFQLWSESELCGRYRLNVQTNPCSLLARDGQPDTELFAWIDRLKPMVQLGAESFHDGVLARWRKRHNARQLAAALDALDQTRQDYTIFHILADYETDAEELIDSVRLLAIHALRHPRMRIAGTAFMIPLYDSDIRRRLEFPQGAQAAHFTEYERAHPEWMDRTVAALADAADEQLHWTLSLSERNSALFSALETMLARWREIGANKSWLSERILAALDELRQRAY